MRVEEDNIKKHKYYSLRQLPMIAGIIAPICILLSIPPLTGDWIKNLNDEDIMYSIPSSEFKPSPEIILLLSLGVFFLFLAQISLILRFFEIKIILNTWICIVGCFLNTLLTTSSIIYSSIKYSLPSTKVFGDGYYATYASSLLSFISFLVLIIDYFKQDRLRGKGSSLSGNQRKLVLIFILVTIWTVIGSLIMCKFQNWTFVRGIYFVLATITTIGFGDYVPKSSVARGFNIFFSSIGIILIGMLIAFIHSVVMDSFEAYYIEQVDKIRAMGLENFHTLTIQKFSRKSKPHKGSEEAERVRRVETIRKMDDQEKELRKSQLSHYIKQLQFSILILLLFWLLGAVIFCALEDWDYFTGLYFCFISFTTIGYGDIIVKPVNSVIVFCIYSLLGLPTMAYFISVSIGLFSCLIETNSDKVEIRRNKKKSTSLNRRVSTSLSTNSEAEQYIELLKALEINTGNEERDLLSKLLTMTEYYNEEMSEFFKESEDLSVNRSEQNQYNEAKLEKIEKYEAIFNQLIDLFNETTKDKSSTFT